MMFSQPTGVLLCNLGTPEAPTARALRPYLREFLSDSRVVDLPRIQWLPVLYSFILPFRPQKSAQLYREIWTEDGSPLLVLSRRLCARVEQRLRSGIAHVPTPALAPATAPTRATVPTPTTAPTRTTVPTPTTAPTTASTSASIESHFGLAVELGMRYGEPSIGSALRKLRAAGCARILVLPLYPQYCAATAASTFDAVWKELQTWRVVPEIRTIRQYPTDNAYITALVSSIRELWDREGEPETLLLSFHGIPKRYAEAGDPYVDQCRETARLVFAQLGMPADRCEISFQSVFGKEEWIEPTTTQTVKHLAESGRKNLDVICPGFAVDCLETLEEINRQNRAIFLQHGGARFRYVPCLNDREDHIEMLVNLLCKNLQGWLPAGEGPNRW